MFPGFIRRLSLFTLLLVIVGFVVAIGPGWPRLLAAAPSDTRAAMQFLRREELNFLVTERVVTQVVVEKHEGSVLFGPKDGYLVGTVELLYGVNLAALDVTAFESRDGTLYVQVPQPELLRSVIDEESLRFVQKRSPLQVLVDNMRNDDLFQRSLLEVGQAAKGFARTHSLAPTRDELVERLNAYAPAIHASTGVSVVFE